MSIMSSKSGREMIQQSLLLSFFFLLPVMAIANTSTSTGTNGHTNTNGINFHRPLKNVVVVGGTHGNEYTGVWCIKSLDRALARSHDDHNDSNNKDSSISSKYPSLDISTLLGNPEAHLANKRFIHEDLNRQFTPDGLKVSNEIGDDNEDDLPWETMRAREIDQLLGPKFHPRSDTNAGSESPENDETIAHVVVDLHSTTSNMGLTIIVAEGDPIMTRAAAYVRYKCLQALHNTKTDCGANGNSDGGNSSNSKEEGDIKVHCILHTHPTRSSRPNLVSSGRHGFTIEVGPVPQGVLRHDAVEKTNLALFYLLEFLELHNTSPDQLSSTLNNWYVSNKVPCFKSAKANKKGQMSGKISWPSDVSNPNFPMYMVHKHLQDSDFELVRTGDVLFVDLDGNEIEYDGSFGDSVYLMFVNEGGYYFESSGTGVAVAIKTEYDLETGVLIPLEDSSYATVS